MRLMRIWLGWKSTNLTVPEGTSINVLRMEAPNIIFFLETDMNMNQLLVSNFNLHHHASALLSSCIQADQIVSIDAKCDEPSLLGNVLDEIKETFSKC